MGVLSSARLAAFLATSSLLLASTQPLLEIPATPAWAAVFSGTVTGGDGKPLHGAQIYVRPWNVGAVTDSLGHYELRVNAAQPGTRATLTAQLLGFQAVSKEVRVEGGSVRVDFQLITVVISLDSLRVTGRRDPVASTKLPFTAAVVQGQAGQAGGAGRGGGAMRLPSSMPRDWNTEAYAAIDENPFRASVVNPLSTFSIDVDRASYANVRRFIRDGKLPPKDAVRIEELINYFSYEDPAPRNDAPFAVRTELAAAPWKPAHKLLRIALKGRSIDPIAAPPGNFVFLIDVSGSMQPANKLPLLKQAFGLLVNELRPVDRVALVVYAGAAGLVLPPTEGSQKEVILAAIERLEAGGTTAGGAGLRLAYQIARDNHIPGGNNRVILATDGDFNVGVSSDAEMMRLVEEKRAQGTSLTVLGFGIGNLKDSKMEILADKGNGNYAYIDGIAEARKVLVHELGGTLLTIAKDVKIQVEFNPARVRGYRLIGYENRLLAAEDFNDDKKDAGELGSGHSVTALYEIIPVGVKTDVDVRVPDSLRYQTPAAQTSNRSELAFVKLRYKQPDGDKSALLEYPVADRNTRTGSDFAFSAAVASFGMILRDSPHKGDAALDRVLALARDGRGEDRGGYRAGFIELVEAARAIDRPVAAEKR